MNKLLLLVNFKRKKKKVIKRKVNNRDKTNLTS